MPDVFLSYSREDQSVARLFAQGLEREGFAVWWDQALRSGENYDQVTEHALREARAVVVLWSRTSVESRWVRAEATQADRMGTLVPVMIEACNRPIMFELKHTAELGHWKGDTRDSAWCAFISDLRRYVPDGTIGTQGAAAAAAGATVRHRYWIIGALAAVLLVVAGAWIWQRMAGAQRVRQQVIPSIASLVDSGKIVDAFSKAADARRFAPDDPLLRSLTPLFTSWYEITTEPVDVDVYVRPYDAVQAPWQHLGRTPLGEVALPRVALRWKFEKPGYAMAERALATQGLRDIMSVTNLKKEVSKLNVEMIADTAQPAGTVLVPGGGAVPFASIESVAQVPPFFMSRYEVTNAEFKEFVDSGGYERRSLWDGLDMRQGSKPLAFGEAMRLFVDSTGRQGPSTWELGTYPEGRGKYPVSGVSWYEAVAYSRFRGMSLPTFFHWLRAALPESELPTSLAASIAPRSNFGTSGPVPGGQYQGVGLYGTYDLYGNVREWLANPGAKGGWLIGGSWEDPDYQYSSTVPTLLLERSRLNGFRLVKNQGDAPNAATLTAALDLLINSSSKVAPKPVSDEVYADYKRQFAYVPGVLHETQPVTMSSNEDWIKQRVTIDAGYNGERLDVIMFLPKRARPPYQPIVFFSGGGAVAFPLKSEDIEPGFAGMPLDYVVKSGRVLVQPIIQGSYERFKSANDPNDRVRDLREWIERRWDIGRTLDYLATRSDIDAARAGFMGLSFGASAALPLVAVESRLKAAVLISGGMPPPGGPLTSQIPLMDVSSHAARIRIPVLMINGRYDEVFPLETAQQSLFRVLGTAPADKRHVVLDFGHGSPPRAETLRETLGWFDKYLGEVRQ